MKYLNFAKLFGAAWLWRKAKGRRKPRTVTLRSPRPKLRAFAFTLHDGRQISVTASSKHKARTILMKALRHEIGVHGRIEPFPVKGCMQVR